MRDIQGVLGDVLIRAPMTAKTRQALGQLPRRFSPRRFSSLAAELARQFFRTHATGFQFLFKLKGM